EALTHLSEAIERQPRLADLRRRRGDLQIKRAERNDALAAAAPLIGLPCRGFNSLSARESALDDYARAIVLYQAVPQAPVERLAATQAALGQALAQLGRADEALRAFDRALSLRPDLAEAHCARGGLLLASRPRRYAEAVEAFDAYLKHGGR